MGRVLYQDSSGMEVVVTSDGFVRLVTPCPAHVFNAAHLANLINGLVHAHKEINVSPPATDSETQ